MINIVTKEKLKELVLQIPYGDSHIFSVIFIKRTTGKQRKMTCRRGVKKHLAGGDLKYNAKSKELLPVFEMQKQQYRSISCDNLLEFKYAGETYRTAEYNATQET